MTSTLSTHDASIAYNVSGNDTAPSQGGDLIPDIRQPVYMIIIYSLAYSIIFLFALIGNVIVIAVVYRNRRMHTLTNLFIVNLAVADILVAVFCIPITLLDSIFNGWRYGAFMCKATPYMQGVSVCASVNSLAAIAIDRYLAICYTLEHKMTWRSAKVIMVSIWAFAFCILLPWTLYYKQMAHTVNGQLFYLCMQDWPYEHGDRNFLLIVFVVCYVIPLSLIICCYFMITVRVWNRDAPGIFRYNNVIQKSKVKVVKMLVLIVVLFAVSWLPLYVIFIILYFDPPDVHSKQYDMLINIFTPIAQWLGMSNSCMNPVIYCFFSKAIRKRTVAMLACAKSVGIPRRQSRFSSTRLMSVDYTNGQITLRLHKRNSDRARNGYCESMFYD